MSSIESGVWVTYSWDMGYHLRAVHRSAEDAVRACSFGGDEIVFLRYGQDIDEAVKELRKARGVTLVTHPTPTTSTTGRP